jgi:DNA-binding NarL/FixJ family response regulator
MRTFFVARDFPDGIGQLVLEEFRDTSSSRRADITPGIGLSKREREVVEHVSKGLSNRDIAMHLPNTQ